MSTRIDCPSAQPGAKKGRIYGIMTGPAEERRLGYLTLPLEPTPELYALAGSAKPTELFRIAAPCAGSACKHFNGSCTLVKRIVESLPAVVNALPDCKIRPTCRWFAQEGGDACLRCPQVVTDNPHASPEQQRIANGD